MAQKATDQPTAMSRYAQLAHAVGTQETVTDLFRMANSDEFKAATRSLSDADLKALRQIYRERMRELDGKIKLSDYVGQVLNVTDVDFWHSQQWGNDGVTIRFHLDNSSQMFKGLTSSAPVVRFFNDLDEMPTNAVPMRILLDQRPVRDAERAAAGQKVFTIKRMPTPTRGDGSDGAPF